MDGWFSNREVCYYDDINQGLGKFTIMIEENNLVRLKKLFKNDYIFT
jgi:hypothetical protein